MMIESEILINIVLLMLLIITALGTILVKDLLISTLLLGIFSLLMAAEYVALSAPDVAITEAAVGAGISSILFLIALTLTGRTEKKSQSNNFIPLLFVLATGLILSYAVLGMPEFGSPNTPTNQYLSTYYIAHSASDTGIPNIVTSVLASYRGFDTLGETFVVFTAAISVLLLLGTRFIGKGGK